MKLRHWLNYVYWAYFAKPAADRVLYQGIRRCHPCRIVQVGLASVDRSRRLVEQAMQYAPGPVQFTGIDMFEAGGNTPLKEFHRAMCRDGVKIKLVPGDVYSGLARFANVLADTQLLLIGKDVPDDALQRAWFYVPRMLADGALVLRESVAGEQEADKPEENDRNTRWERISVTDIFTWADQQRSARRAA